MVGWLGCPHALAVLKHFAQDLNAFIGEGYAARTLSLQRLEVSDGSIEQMIETLRHEEAVAETSQR